MYWTKDNVRKEKGKEEDGEGEREEKKEERV
jgi:hypothetical protein